MEDEKYQFTNRLIHEKSPYLLQHAHNPVDWYPWGEEAFQHAKEQNKPIFLSIGYATCHWCHVMEKESFENSQIAQLLNETFINIKVDREELPEVDSLYMEFAQSMMAGAAGWPLNVILTPDLKPFFATTYIPPTSRHGLMGLNEMVEHLQEVWSSEDMDELTAQADQIIEVFKDDSYLRGETIPDEEFIEAAAEWLYRLADPVYGGMKGSPKFPIGYQSNFMIREAYMAEDSRALFLVERTLEMMHRGGIYDHLGGGFSRYSIDEKWLVPHFEKMLYDNAILIYSYLECWQACKRDLFRNVCEDVIAYILREMTDAEGAFYSAEDADSEGVEGLFYTWEYDEIIKILGQKESELFCEFYGITQIGNFEGRNILHTPLPLKEFAAIKHIDADKLESEIIEQKKKLFKVRQKRVHPFKDDKIISSWNGLMIFSLVEAGLALDQKRYIQAAVKAAKFLRANMWKGGILLRRWRQGEARFKGGLEEYSYVIKGLLSLFEAGCGAEWLEWALEMTAILERDFKSEDGAFYQTDGEDETLIVRKCQFSDGAEPSGNAIHCENLLRLFQITGDEKYFNQAEDILKAVERFIETYSPGYCYHLMCLNRYYDLNAPNIVIALNDKEQHLEQLMHLIYSTFIPHKTVVIRKEGDETLFKLIPFVREQKPIENKTTVYICREGVCEEPLNDIDEIIDAIKKL